MATRRQLTKMEMGPFQILLCLLLSCAISEAFALKPIARPAALQLHTTSRLSASPLDEPDNGTQTSRRQWLAGVAGASLIGLTSPAFAATPIAPTLSTCDPTVSVWERNGRVIYLLGTAHISASSAQLAGQLVQDTHPDAVFVELDLKRVGGSSAMAKKMQESNTQGVQISSADGTPTRLLVSPVGRTAPMATAGGAMESTSTMASIEVDPSTTPMTVDPATATAAAVVEETKTKTSGGGGGGFMSNLAGAAVGKGIKSMYQKLGNEGFNPGEEFIVAIREGQKMGSTVVLGDQDVDVTLRRMAQAIQQTDLSRLINPDSELEQSMKEMLPTGAAGTNAIASGGTATSELTQYVEVIKTKENVKKIMGLLRNEAPAIYQVMVSERDAYMAAGLNALNEFAIITAVMGLAHVDGVESNLRSNGWKPVPLRCPKPI